jgi:hypothetical protein
MGGTAKALILDNHDDFGGHAKRNEFHYNGRTLALNGGTLNIESYGFYNAPAKQLLSDIGIDIDGFLSVNAKNRRRGTTPARDMARCKEKIVGPSRRRRQQKTGDEQRRDGNTRKVSLHQSFLFSLQDAGLSISS